MGDRRVKRVRHAAAYVIGLEAGKVILHAGNSRIDVSRATPVLRKRHKSWGRCGILYGRI
ncbi:hypothetical protein AGMMS49974_01090 [Deltaproteobacteria bacterium]|nr:hypothetical protein AGMMS49925_00370 [Deltaproteobacteria bacterium]GHU93403.1 hypothetical protein AGMMS49974_01090 [Deltaproteobacteria bacterium]